MEPSTGWFKRETLSDDERRHALAHELGLPFVQLDRDSISLEAMVLVPEPLSREHNIVAYRLGDPSTGLGAGGTLEVALLDIDELNELEFLRSRYRLLPRLTSRESMTRGLLHYQRHLRATYGAALERADSPNLLDSLLRHALHSQASDLHLQNTQEGLLVRYRINGSLKSAMTLPPAAGKNVITKLRALASVPMGSLPREGSLRVDLGGGEDLVVRVSSVPIIHGEKLVLHLVREKARRGHTLESLGLHGEALEAVHKTLLKRRGLVVVTGPSDSGKSTILYTLLDLLNVPEVSIATVEQEVEYVLPRVAQTDIGASGVSAAAALRAALKQDCDVVMLSRVTDAQVARIAAAAAQRGVLVLASTEDPELFPAPDLLIQTALLRRLGGKQFADKHKLSRAQADQLEESADLARVLAALKEEGKLAKEVPWKDLQFSRPVSSSEDPTGYLSADKAGSGLVGIQEVTREGSLVGLNLLEDAVFKAAQGITSVEEVLKLTQ